MSHCLTQAVPSPECALAIVEVIKSQVVIAELFAAFIIVNVIIYVVFWSIQNNGRIGKFIKRKTANIDLRRFSLKR